MLSVSFGKSISRSKLKGLIMIIANMDLNGRSYSQMYLGNRFGREIPTTRASRMLSSNAHNNVVNSNKNLPGTTVNISEQFAIAPQVHQFRIDIDESLPTFPNQVTRYLSVSISSQAL